MNCTRDTLIKGLVTLLPSTTTVVEILEISSGRSGRVLAACHSLKEAGYISRSMIMSPMTAGRAQGAGGHHQGRDATHHAGAANRHDQAFGARHAGCWRKRSKRVRSSCEARDQGFVYFQGYFFRRPEMIDARYAGEPPELLADAAGSVAAGIGYAGTGKTRQDGSLGVLPAVAVFKFDGVRLPERDSFGAACAVDFGERDVRRWVRLVAAVGAGQEKTSDLVLSALVRGRFGELLAPRVAHGESDLFLLGLLSLIDVDAGNSDGGRAGEESRSIMRLRQYCWGNRACCVPVYQLMLAHESGEWEAAAELSGRLHLDSEDVAGCTGRRRSGRGKFPAEQ